MSANIRQTQITLDSFNFISNLGEGMEARVFLVQHKTSKHLFALKVVERNEKWQNRDSNESAVFDLMHGCPFIVSLHG